MLKKIIIESFIIFEQLNLDLSEGMTAITGITGSGKSVLFDAIEFAMGNKTSRSTKNKPAEVELIFNIDAQEVSIKHIKNSTSKFYINNTLSNRAEVQELAKKFLSCQRQNQHLQCLDNKYQRNILDQYANVQAQVTDLNTIYTSWKAQKLEYQKQELQLSTIEYDLIQHYLEELQDLNPSNQDWQNLNAQLANARSNKKNQAALQESEMLINRVLNDLQKLSDLNNSENINTCLNQAMISAQEAESEINKTANQPVLSQLEIETIEERMQEYFRIARKHKVKPDDLELKLSDFLNSYNLADELMQNLKLIQTQISELKLTWHAQAKELATTRNQAAAALAKLIAQELKQLNMNSTIELKFTLEANENPSIDGGGSLEFLIATKSNQALKSVEKVVSGGEAARLSLVVQKILAQEKTAVTYLMDEVDVGVSGAVASAIGELLKYIAINNQVLCITHTPQVAGLSQHHISMSEGVKVLSKADRVKEIAAMLCHAGITEAAKTQAEELLS